MLKTAYKTLENPAIYNIVQKLLGVDRVYRKLRETIAEQLKGIIYNKVLDVGCGTGLFTDCFKGEYTGIDINEEYIKKARAYKKGTFKTGDATALQFEDETFDLVFTLGVLHHLDAGSREKMLKEMRRVCKTGGHILIVDGLVPSNRLNIIGYVLAKLDRGPFKMRLSEFKKMLTALYSEGNINIAFNSLTVFPHEYVVTLIKKIQDVE